MNYFSRFLGKYLIVVEWVAFAFCLPYAGYSQDLRKHIPGTASLVLEVNSPELFQALPLIDINNSSIGESLLREINDELKVKVTNLEDLGVDFNQPAFMFLESKENQLNMAFLLPLTSAQTLENFILDNGYEIFDTGNAKSIVSEQRIMLSWNDQMASFSVIFPASDSYYMEDESGVKKSEIGYYMEEANENIMKVASFRRSREKKADLNIWLGNLSPLMQYVAQEARLSENQDVQAELLKKVYGDYEYFAGSLFFDDDELRIDSQGKLLGENAELLHEISKGKFDDRLLNYLDIENSLAYMTYHVNFEKMLEEYPRFIMREYFPYLPQEEGMDEAYLGMELFSTLLDEEAVGEIIQGDFAFNLMGIEEMDIEYTTYEYDSNFNLIPKKEFRKEMVPDFMFLMTSQEITITTKTIEYLNKKGILSNEGGYYKLSEEEQTPIPVFLMLKDDILFIGTNSDHFGKITNNRYVPRVPSTSRKRITSNQMVAFGAVSKIFQETEREMSNMTDLEILKSATSSKELIFQTGRIKRGKIKGSISLSTPDNYKNSLQFLYSLINQLFEK